MLSIYKMNKEDLYNNCLNKIGFYKNNLPKINDLVFAEIKGFNDNGIDCLLKEYNINTILDFKEFTNSKKMYQIKKLIKKKKNIVLSVKSNFNNYIEVVKSNLSQEDEDNFINYINFYNKIRTTFIKSFIWYSDQGNLSINDVLNFLDKNFWNKLNINNYLNLIDKFYDDTNTFSDFINPEYSLIKEKINYHLKTFITKPTFRIKIVFTINCLDKEGIIKIINFIEELEKNINYSILYIDTPYYTIDEKKQFSNKNEADNYLNHILLKLKQCAVSDSILFKISESNCIRI